MSSEYVLNPLTQRSIQKYGRLYNQLVKQGIIDPNQENALEVEPQDPEEDEKEIELADEPTLVDIEIDSDEDKVDTMVQDVVDGKEDQEELAKTVAVATDAVMRKYKRQLEAIEDEEELYDEVHRLVHEEMKNIME